jgi:stage V sporulation protein B
MLHEESLGKKFVNRGFWLYAFTFLIWPLGYITKMIISRDLSVSEVWVIYGVISFVTLISTYNDLGCTESLNYFLPKHIINKTYGKAKYLLGLTLKIQTITSIFLCLTLFFIAPWLARVYFWNTEIVTILRISWLYFIGVNIFHIVGILFSIAQDTKLQKWVELVRILSVTIAVSILYFSESGNTELYMWAWVAGLFIAILFAIYWAYNKYYKTYFSGIESILDIEERRAFFRYSFATLLTSNIWMMLSQVDMQMIIYILWAEATGYYSNYLSLMNIPFIFITPIIAFLFPVISELNSRNDTIKMRMLCGKFTLYFSIIGIWISVFMFQMWEHLASIFFSEKFRMSGIILAYSALFLCFNLLIQVNFQFLAGTWQIQSRAKILMTILPINIVLNYIFIHLYGVAGSALAVGLSWIPLWYLSYRATREYHEAIPILDILKNIILALCAYGIIYFWSSFLYISNTILLLCFAVLINLLIFLPGNLKIIQEFIWIIKESRK